jgi:hypothetical protein
MPITIKSPLKISELLRVVMTRYARLKSAKQVKNIKNRVNRLILKRRFIVSINKLLALRRGGG